ncbi:helix-turn-helix domain-containing protein [Allisonella histaminiformans]|uniref:helix-turn-helix domain-containing protein n=1 Tax=Allisonella histaminiformans TaxID=209880 RepID=UPI0035225FF6
MEFNDVMTLEEAAERWKKTSDALRQNCLGRVKNGFRKGEYRKSGRVWRLHGQGWNEYMGKR